MTMYNDTPTSISALLDSDASACAEAIARGDVTSVELTDASIARLQESEAHLGVMSWDRYERARADALIKRTGPFAGVPMLLKDLDTHMAGELMTDGNVVLANAQLKAESNSFLVDKFLNAGFVVLGATTPAEFGTSALTEPFNGKLVRNPWDDTRNPGGSSGGSAAAVAAALVPIAHASDGGGSIRIPASFCGLIGLKPSRGRVSAAPQDWGAGPAVEFVVSRSVRDSAALLDALSGPAPGDTIVAPLPRAPFRQLLDEPLQPLRIGLWVDHPDGVTAVDPAHRAGVEHAAKVLADAGHHIEVSHPAVLDEYDYLVDVMRVLLAVGTHAGALQLEEMLGRPLGEGDLEPLNLAMAKLGSTVTGVEFAGAIGSVNHFCQGAGAWWGQGFDLLLSPVTALRAPRNGEMVCTSEDPIAWFDVMCHHMGYTPPWNLSGQPAIAVPSLVIDGLPTSAHLVAAYGREDLLLQVASQLEQLAPWPTIAPSYRTSSAT